MWVSMNPRVAAFHPCLLPQTPCFHEARPRQFQLKAEKMQSHGCLDILATLKNAQAPLFLSPSPLRERTSSALPSPDYNLPPAVTLCPSTIP